jgi:hypothetical protein
MQVDKLKQQNHDPNGPFDFEKKTNDFGLENPPLYFFKMEISVCSKIFLLRRKILISLFCC